MGSPGNICAICGVNYDSGALFCPRDGAPLGARAPKGPDDFIGVELPGQIRIERLIGIGSMGRVYRGFQAGVGRPVAVKILHRELSANSTLVARFLREAQIASRLSHPNVVQAILSGQLPPGPDGDGAMYMVMEYLDGISLRSAFAAAGGALPLPRALRIVLQLCEAVGEAHVAGIVHRDLKPENVMLLKRGHDADFVKILDFGIARLPGGNTQAVTQAGAVFGTARYVSPEGAIGSPVGPPADVYAIATILYQALAGRTPFDGETAIEVLGRQINDPPPPLRSIAHVPDRIASAVMQNLAKRPEDRSKDARAFGLLLVDAARASGLAPEALVPRSALIEASSKGAPPLSGDPTQPQSFGPALAGKIAAANESAAAQLRDVEHSAKAASARSSRGPLAILIGCFAGGAALAAVGAYHFQESSRAEAPGPQAAPSNAPSNSTGGGPQAAPSNSTGGGPQAAPSNSTGGADAGLEPEGGHP
jgi:serine/threonine-protein kinase